MIEFLESVHATSNLMDTQTLKREDSTAFLFRANRKHGTETRDGRTDRRGATLNAAPREGRMTTEENKMCTN